jgi:hypothetical protein
MHKRLPFVAAIIAAIVVLAIFPLAQTQVDTFEKVRVRSGAADALTVAGGATVSGQLNTPTLSVTTLIMNGGRYASATLQPGFLAYNGTVDSSLSGTNTVEFDLEVFDHATNFSANTFTAPVAGQYHFCTTVAVTDNAASVGRTAILNLVTSNRTYKLDTFNQPTATNMQQPIAGCTYADMDASDTAFVQVVFSAGADWAIAGASVSLWSFFSGRLVP